MAITATPREQRSWSLEKMPPWVGGIIGVVIIVLLWWLGSQTLYTATHAIPTPLSVVKHYFDTADWETLKTDFGPTTTEALWGFLWGDALALVAAGLVLLVPQFAPVVNQVAVVSYCLPPIAIGAILVEAAPLGSSIPPIVLAALAPFFTTVVGSLVGLQAASASSLDLVTAYGGSSLTQLRKVRLIAALPNIFAALKIAAPAAFLGAVLGEFVGGGGDNSVGVALISAQSHLQSDILWWLALTSGAVAGLGYLIVGIVGRLVTPWSSGQGGSR
ncbi:ABC transporter permease subunit [Jatrophihabitans sp.]|uniref:ABC transporter permease n=1 Tax=Jatrophihabitans sp. TaxID=1932789 RepID=UPI0030C688C4|nr:transporter permease [Jatrophihabitans sp.]